MGSLVIDGLTKLGGIAPLSILDVDDNISMEEAADKLKEILCTSKDLQGAKDALVLINAYLVIELGPKDAKLVWDKLYDCNCNEVTKLLRGNSK